MPTSDDVASLDEKYVVYKKEEFDAYLKAAGPEPEPLKEAFVLRPSDIFAAPTLHAYAHTILTALELDAIRGGTLTSAERERLETVADAVSATAGDWSSRHLKIPD